MSCSLSPYNQPYLEGERGRKGEILLFLSHPYYVLV